MKGNQSFCHYDKIIQKANKGKRESRDITIYGKKKMLPMEE